MKVKLGLIVSNLMLASLYVVAAKLGLSLALTVEQITTVWPPSGLALAALVLYGYRLWPGVFLGALVANLLTNEPPSVAFGIATGNTFEAVIGALLLRRIVRLQPNLSRVKDVVGLGVFAAFVSTMVSASLGTFSLALGGLIPWTAQPTAWSLWWFGDMAGVLLLAPFLLVWHDGWRQLNKTNIREIMALIVASATVALIIFFGPFSFLGGSYLVFPFVVWAAFRFKQLGVTAVSLVILIIAILGTVIGQGPFAGFEGPEQQLISLLLFTVFVTMSGLFIAVAVWQREVHEQKLASKAEELLVARNKILSELDYKTKQEKHLKSANESITKILDRLMDENPRASRDL